MYMYTVILMLLGICLLEYLHGLVINSTEFSYSISITVSSYSLSC